MTRSVNIQYEVTPRLLQEFLRYEPDTGKLFWRERARWWFKTERDWRSWTGRFAGEEAFAVENGDGYPRGSIFGKKILAHRAAFAIYHGRWPDDQLDHINGVKDDNRISNLREVTNVENSRNAPLRSTNTSGITGVSWHGPRRKWVAKLMIAGRTEYLGIYSSFDLAVAVRLRAERIAGFHENHGRGSEIVGDTGILKAHPEIRAKIDEKIARWRDE